MKQYSFYFYHLRYNIVLHFQFMRCFAIEYNVHVLSFQIVLDQCQNRRHCRLLASTTVFGQDPCPSTNKYLEVTYKCRPSKLIKSCEKILTSRYLEVTCKCRLSPAFHCGRNTRVSARGNFTSTETHRTFSIEAFPLARFRTRKKTSIQYRSFRS